MDQDALVAAADLIGRSGASGFTVGYLDDDVPIENARWYAHAQYRGARLQVENQAGPVEAAEALARRVLETGMCNHCRQPVRLTDDEPGCRWTRMGQRWVRGCEEASEEKVVDLLGALEDSVRRAKEARNQRRGSTP